jgi:predicted secreted hydrolase
VKRRHFLAAMGALAASPASPAEIRYPDVKPGYAMAFPRDHGAHPDFRTEWWYITGWLKTSRGEDLGFQVTFFRTRTPYAIDENPSAFAPRQLLLAHAALSDPKLGRLRHDQRAARPALGVAGFEEGTTRVWIDAWRLELQAQAYRAVVPARDFGLDLIFASSRPPLLQGLNGLSRKGRGENEASYYYSRPALEARGSIERGAGKETVTGSAWLDHEWSSQYMAAAASGWDWIGINLADGGALMAFRMRGKDGGALYAGGTLMRPDGASDSFGPQDVEFMPLRLWRSPRSGTEYPVAMQVKTRNTVWRIEPLLEDQELDSRSSTATIYWEGAVRVSRDGIPAGRGYLELTGYWRPMRIGG